MVPEYDVFIDYHADDNLPSNEETRGWVDRFQQFLGQMYQQAFGQSLQFLPLSSAIPGNPDASGQPARVRICVLSPAFVQSTAHLQRSIQFVQGMNAGAGETSVSGHTVLRVVKYPVSPTDQPTALHSLPEYALYHADPLTGKVLMVDDCFDHPDRHDFWLKLADLAYDIHALLVQTPREQTLAVAERNRTIYLAETSHDLLVQRHIIKRELQRYGYRVLPGKMLPTEINAVETIVRQCLSESQLSIHLIGESYGDIPTGGDLSIVDLQNKFAAEHSRTLSNTRINSTDPAFVRYVWVTPELKHADERQKAFVDSIRRNIKSFESTEVLQTSLENFKTVIRDELVYDTKKGEKAREYNKSRISHALQVYLIYDQLDSEAVAPLSNRLSGQGFNVIVPDFEGDLLHVRRVHTERLQQCDVALIYKGQMSEQWLHVKALDILKAPGYGRTKPILEKIVMLPAADNHDYVFVQSPAFRIVRGEEEEILSLPVDFFSLRQEEV